MKLNDKQINAALHTLWQAAVASGGIGEVLKSVTDHSVNVPGVEQGGYVAGVAVAGAAASLAKSYLANWLVGHKTSKLAKADAQLADFAAAFAAYQAKHASDGATLPTTVAAA